MTLPLELIARIRRLHYAEHWKVGTIVAQLGIHIWCIIDVSTKDQRWYANYPNG